ncbi:MAG: 7-cyano-7-deazaguanine synthase [Phycisphaerales bacterium]|nr:7-cyano-7-deazaguanine synthase [Phycisphaerales bacterium]
MIDATPTEVTSSDGVLLICRGDVPALAALAIEADPARVVLWHPQESGTRGERRAAAAAQLGRAYGVREGLALAAPVLGLPSRPTPGGVGVPALLVQATVIAMQTGCDRIVWPIACGTAFDAVATAFDQANLAATLVESDPNQRRRAFDLPVADLSDEQIADLVDDAGAPVTAAWPCDHAGTDPCGSCSECVRWHAAFRSRGRLWPWRTAAPVPV